MVFHQQLSSFNYTPPESPATAVELRFLELVINTSFRFSPLVTMPPRSSGLRCRMDLISRNTMTPVLVAMSAIIVVVAMHMHHDPDVYSSPFFRFGLSWLVFVLLAACAVLALEDAGRIPDAAQGPPCVVLALEDAGPPRTSYRVPLSSLLYCVAQLGWPLLGLLARTTSSVEELRVTTVLLRARSGALPPFAIVGFIFLVVGACMGFQLLPLLRKLQVACFEMAFFTLGPMLI